MRLYPKGLPVQKLLQFSGFRELLVAMESQLLKSYEEELSRVGSPYIRRG